MRRATAANKSLLTLLLTSTLLSQGVGGQQQQSQAPEGIFSEVLDVRVVNVEVVVTDKDGLRVQGLERSDFRLLVDGEERPIDYFSEIIGGQVTTTAELDPVDLPAALEPGQAVGTSYLVFIDDQFSIARDRNRVLKRMDETLSGRLNENDRMALVAFDGKELAMLTSWTNSDRVLKIAFREAYDRKAFGLQRLAQLRMNDSERRERNRLQATSDRFVLNAGGDLGEGSSFKRLNPVELNYAQRLEDQLRRSVSAAVASLRSFATPPGRKVMMILSGGWPVSPAEYTVASYEASFEDVGWAATDNNLDSGRGLYGSLTDTANLLGYTLYPVDVPGMNWRALDAEYQSPDSFSGAGAAQTAGGLFPREQQGHDLLNFLARETGGEAMINAQRDLAFERVVADTRSYYWLGFSPDRKEDDQAHKIEIEVLGKGLRARSRKGFLDFSRQSESTMMVESALFFGSPPSSVPLDLHFGKPRRAGRGKIAIALDVGIPMDNVTLVSYRGKLVADLEIRVTVMDESGARSATPMDTIAIEGERPPAPGQMFRYQTDLTLRKRRHRIIVAVIDPLTGTMMSSATDIDP